MPSPFGNIKNPLDEFSSYGEFDGTGAVSGTGAGGLVGFVSNMIKFVTIAAGLMVLINLIVAGFTYISAGSDPKKTEEAWAKIYMSLIGLVIIVGAYAIAALLGYLLFNDPTAILSPAIYGPGADE